MPDDRVERIADRVLRAQSLEAFEKMSENPAAQDGRTLQQEGILEDRIEQLRSKTVSLRNAPKPKADDHIVRGWFDAGGMSLVFGKQNTGKTFFALDIGFHVAANRDWNGCRVKGGPVLYCAAEGGRGIFARLEAAKIAHEWLGPALDRFAVFPSSIDLFEPLDAKAISGFVSCFFDRPPAMIIVDTVSRAMGRGDQDRSRDMGIFVRNVDSMREASGAHVCLIHHPGKDTDRGSRGSSALPAAIDTEIKLVARGNMTTAEITKQRDGPVGGVFSFRLSQVVIGVDADGENITSAIPEPVSPKDVPMCRERSGLPLMADAVLNALRNFISEHGEPNPDSTCWTKPGMVQTAKRSEFRKYAESQMAQKNKDTRRKAVARGLENLIANGIVGSNEDYIWLAP